MGIEPTRSAWKAEILPLNYTRKIKITAILTSDYHIISVLKGFVNTFLKKTGSFFGRFHFYHARSLVF